MVKQEMARLSIEILGISELKWTGMGQFNSDYHYVYYCGQESLRRNEVTLTVNRSPKRSTWMQPQKWPNDLSSFPKQTIQPHCDPSLSPNHWCQRSWSWQVLWRCTTPSRTNTKKRCPSHYRGLECKSRKSKDTRNNRQVWHWSTKWSRAREREHTGHSKHPFPTTQEMTLHMDIIRWSILKSDQFCYL